MAARDRGPAVHRPVRRLRHAPLLAQGTGADLGRHPGLGRRSDVGRHPRTVRSFRGLLGRPADHPDPGHLRPGLRLPPGGARRAGRAVHPAAAGETPMRALCRNVRGVPRLCCCSWRALCFRCSSGRRQHRQLCARRSDHPVRRRLPGRVVRGRLQALPQGQAQAADALGLCRWKKTGFIVLHRRCGW